MQDRCINFAARKREKAERPVCLGIVEFDSTTRKRSGGRHCTAGHVIKALWPPELPRFPLRGAA